MDEVKDEIERLEFLANVAASHGDTKTMSWAIKKAAQQNAHLTATPYYPHISENIDGTCPYCDLPKPPQVA